MSKRYTHALSPKAARILRTPDAEGGHAPAKGFDQGGAERYCEEVGTDAVEGAAKNTMTYIMIDELVRREVGKLLRVDYRGKFLCSSCLVNLVRDTLGTNYTTSEIDQTMDKVFDSPGALMRIPAFICAECLKTMPGLGSTLRA